jgi:endonuclease-3
MMTSPKSEAVLAYLKATYPDASCALHFNDDYQCLVAILLSAQTTDKSVNAATPNLFKDFPSPKELSKASLPALESDIKRLGLYHTKAVHLLALGKVLHEQFHDVVPHDFEILTSLPGVGTKTAGVFLAERMGRPALPVDTHIHRIACRLGYAKEKQNPLQIEALLEKSFAKQDWIFLHHAFILFGREKCGASQPHCLGCPLDLYCSYFKRNASTKGK